MKKMLIILGAITAILLMVSTSTAVPQVNNKFEAMDDEENEINHLFIGIVKNVEEKYLPYYGNALVADGVCGINIVGRDEEFIFPNLILIRRVHGKSFILGEDRDNHDMDVFLEGPFGKYYFVFAINLQNFCTFSKLSVN